MKKKEKIQKKEKFKIKHSAKSSRYKSVMFVSPANSHIEVHWGDRDESIVDVIKRAYITKEVYDIRRTALFEKYALFTAILYTSDKALKNVDCAVPLYYALPKFYSTGGIEIFIMKGEKNAIAILQDGEFIYYKEIKDVSVDYVVSEIEQAYQSFEEQGVFLSPFEEAKVILLYDSLDDVPLTKYALRFPKFSESRYSLKDIVYDDVLNFIKPYKNKFVGEFSIQTVIQDFVNFLFFGESNLKEIEKKIFKTISISLLIISIIFFSNITLTWGERFLQYRESIIQKDLQEITAKKETILAMQKKYADLIKMAKNYTSLKQQRTDLIPIITQIYVVPPGVSVQSFSIKGNSVNIMLSSPSAAVTGQYVSSLIKSGYFASVSLPSAQGVNLFSINATLTNPATETEGQGG
ncbi:MAG: PilN domain-containing protein [Conexivisphaerales archaeon]